jgi:lipid-A-disaccharide synthase
VFVAIDYPDFNFTLGKALHRLGVPVVYYISPQLWAWRSGRLQTMKRFVDRVLTIFPFEPAIYEGAGIPAQFVGHPLVDLIPPTEPRDAFLASLGLSAGAPTVALLPGSRHNEVRRILPVIVDACPLIRAREPRAQFVVARAPGLDDHLFDSLSALSSRGVPLAVVERRADDVLASADAVITASGTATVQAALHECPMVIVYRLSPATYRLGIRFVRVDTYGMVNLVAGRRIATELIQDRFTPEATASECLALLTDAERAERVKAGLGEVRGRLGGRGASARAARAVLAAARGESPTTAAASV